jgi:hypothetical protein
MSYQGVSFDDEQQQNRNLRPTPVVRGMAGWLIRKRIVDNEGQANLILLIIAIAIFVLSGIIFISNIGSARSVSNTNTLNKPL